jgi:hypothetical protein
MVGFEPTVCGLGDRCQFHSDRIPLVGEVGCAPTISGVSDRRMSKYAPPQQTGASYRNQTRVRLFTRQVLYQHELSWLGYGTRIRTQITRSRAACPTVERYRSG